MSNNTSKEPETLLFEEFSGRVRERIFDHLPEDYKDARIETFTMRRLNDSYNAMQLFRDGDELRGVPVINMDALYDAYYNGVSWDEIMRAAAGIVLTTGNVTFDRFEDYKYARTRLIIRVSNWSRNEDLKDELPNMKYGDIMVTYHLMLEGVYDGVTSARISYSMLEDYGIDAETLHRDTMESCPLLLPPVLAPVDNMINATAPGSRLRKRPLFSEAVEKIDFEKDKIYCLTNSIGVGGAAVMFYPDVLDMIADKARSDLYILPSSVHEVLLVPVMDDIRPSFLKELVQNVNREKMMMGIMLADSVFRYDREAGSLTEI